MKLIEQKSDSKISLLESKKRDGKYIGRIKISNFVEAGKENKNERIYPKEVLESALAKIKGELPIPGNIEHPEKSGGDLQSISHEIESIKLKGKLGEATANILNTNSGKDLLALLKSGIKIGSSMRGVGKVENNSVQEGYQLLSIDFVLTPSFENRIALQESKFDERVAEMVKQSVKKQLNERNAEKRHEIILEQFSEAKDSGYSGSLEQWKELLEIKE